MALPYEVVATLLAPGAWVTIADAAEPALAADALASLAGEGGALVSLGARRVAWRGSGDSVVVARGRGGAMLGCAEGASRIPVAPMLATGLQGADVDASATLVLDVPSGAIAISTTAEGSAPMRVEVSSKRVVVRRARLAMGRDGAVVACVLAPA